MTADARQPPNGRRAELVAQVFDVCQQLCRPRADATEVARGLGQIVGRRERDGVLAVRPSSAAWRTIEVYQSADGQVGHVELAPAAGLSVPVSALEPLLGPAGEGIQLHWDSEPIADFWVELDGFACSVFAQLPHPVLDRGGEPGVRLVTVRRDGPV